jgi:putative colanic acid biosynthesis acetyltransferase WcaF
MRRIVSPAAGGERSLPVRGLWYFTEKLLLQSHLNPSSAIRSTVLALFGAKIGRNVIIKPGVRVKFPWKLTLGDGAAVGEDVWIDNIEKVELKNNSVVSQGTYLCTGNHDWSNKDMPLLAKPITVEECAWVGARSVIGPGVTVGRNALVRLGSVVTKDVPSISDDDRYNVR